MIDREAIPAPIVRQLLRHGVPPSAIETMTRAQAVAKAADLWSSP